MKRSHFFFALGKLDSRSPYFSISGKCRVHASVHPYQHHISIKLPEVGATRFGIGGGRNGDVLAAEIPDIDGVLDLAVEGGALKRRIAPTPGVLPTTASHDGAGNNV